MIKVDLSSRLRNLTKICGRDWNFARSGKETTYAAGLTLGSSRVYPPAAEITQKD